MTRSLLLALLAGVAGVAGAAGVGAGAGGCSGKAASGPAVVAGAPAGKVTAVQGTVTARRGEARRPLAMGDAVSGDDVVETGADGRVTIVIDHNQVPFSLGPGRSQEVGKSPAWSAPRGTEVAVTSADRSGAAGRNAEREAADTLASAPGAAAAPPPPWPSPPPSMAMAPAAAAQTAPMAVAPGGGAADDGADGARSDRPAKTAAARHADQELAPLDEAPPPPPPLEPSIGAGSVAGSAAGSAAAADVAADADDADHAEHADKGSGDEPTLETRLSKETPRGLALARRVTVTARIAAVDVRGGLAGDIVLAKVRARAEALRACAGDAAPGVAFELELTVAASGKVTASRATGGAADADACLARELRGLGFAAASKATTAHLRLDLAAE